MAKFLTHDDEVKYTEEALAELKKTLVSHKLNIEFYEEVVIPDFKEEVRKANKANGQRREAEYILGEKNNELEAKKKSVVATEKYIKIVERHLKELNG